ARGLSGGHSRGRRGAALERPPRGLALLQLPRQPIALRDKIVPFGSQPLVGGDLPARGGCARLRRPASEEQPANGKPDDESGKYRKDEFHGALLRTFQPGESSR